MSRTCSAMRDLLPGPARWARFNVEPMSFTVLPWPPAAAKDLFLARFYALVVGRREDRS